MNANHHTNRLSWIEQLPEVNTPILRQRDEILALFAQIDALQQIAMRRQQALEEKIATLWLPAEIDLAKRRMDP
jgi:hypothetical protein